VVTDPQTNKHSHKPTDRTDYNAASAQCNDGDEFDDYIDYQLYKLNA